MVFTRLDSQEKNAFFDLLDEYFTSRPELLSSLGASPSADSNSPSLGGLNSRSAASSAVHSALAANPEATANLISAGLRHGSQNSSVKNSPFASAASDPNIANSIGRVAAASLAFQSGKPPVAARNTPPPPTARNTPPPPPAARSMPPALPRRVSSTDQEEEDTYSLPPPVNTPAGRNTGGAPGLVSGKSFGDVNTTSVKSSLLSIRHGTANKSKAPPSVAPPIPSAFPKRQNNFAPPPVRRLTSDDAPNVRTPSPEPEPEPEEQGEWAEALYDYNSGEAGDLVLSAHEHIKIVSKDSDDWWTGEVDGRTGLFPASYAKLL
ncbi:hypothetical protein M0805_000792 [Coniferiporia weirii]|nr:hypothetical protein M0805_000792 [Coniferiporia weirii]